ncbi:MAG TPA: SCO1664 family protein [Propionicimonas sp.]|nr:SCO1664 family protein [Propionicimonas sp.]
MPARPLDNTSDSDERVLSVLAEGAVELVGRIVPRSNLALLVEVGTGVEALAAVYKPQIGERPLWDFEPGLHRNEAAAYVLSDWLGWDLVPPTIVRYDAPAGVGSLQAYIDSDPSEHYFTLYDRAPETRAQLRALAAFDVVANNADRKSGHVLRDPDGRIKGIDHGLCFAADDKLRTVVWDFAGEPVPPDLLARLGCLLKDLPPGLDELITVTEVEALQGRVQRLLRTGVYPTDYSGRRVPWPLV